MPPEYIGKMPPPSTKEEQHEQLQQKEVFPGYHSLCVRSRVSSDSSGDDDDDSDRRDDMENDDRTRRQHLPMVDVNDRLHALTKADLTEPYHTELTLPSRPSKMR